MKCKTIYAHWDAQHIKLTWLPEYLPFEEKVTSVHGICFEHDKVLLVKIENRMELS